MTKKVFWQDPYLTRLDTVITGVNAQEVTVSQTILYAFAGGQESDAGSIGGHTVRQARKDGKEIIYTLDDGHGLALGDDVPMLLDWERRYRLMRLHFAAEIILELTYRRFNAIQKIGAHIAQDKSRIDFDWAENLSPTLPSLQEEAQTLIREDRPILSAFSDEENERRYWEIAGFARVSCGGTHIKTTGEVGQISLKRKNVGKGKERIEIFVD
jgi:alanyl-tRNA synthetase